MGWVQLCKGIVRPRRADEEVPIKSKKFTRLFQQVQDQEIQRKKIGKLGPIPNFEFFITYLYVPTKKIKKLL
jgi:hypothetical protein